ncbi:DNA ligase-1 [Motilibacter peucedani]|uniref:Probable DNA ligase n=1 Tax=Motilibacter peucedani TaxID=598650 RepID=A0A420XRR1_9ACTN|nr:ATP-dependent DNA ligase [Motilibacter peucedani]RKS77568.1 DNA ligase-1 [Motilibacter peucedani]
MLLAEIAAASADLQRTRSRLAKTARLAEVLSAATPDEVAVVAAYLSGELPQRRTGAGWAALQQLPPAADEPTLTIAGTDRAWQEVSQVSGTGSQARRRALLDALFSRATPEEQRLLRGLALGELRQGALDAQVIEAFARSDGLALPELRRAVMLAGSLPPVAAAVRADGPAALDRFVLEVGRPVLPMLASTAGSVTEALERLGAAVVEAKIDGIRVQVHRSAEQVRVFSRSLDDITERLPDVVELVRELAVDTVVLDGEAVALGHDGRPHPFQATAGRTGSRVDVASARTRLPLTPLFFDVLHVDGRDLLALPASERHAVLDAVVPARLRVARLETADADAGERFAADVLAQGHEGVVVKAPGSLYDAGRRGAAWLKVKPVHTFDLLVLGAEWGSGRRRGWLSNLHLGARDPEGGPPVMLGKTFKGLTDAMLEEQTAALQELVVDRPPWGVVVRPELVVEIALDGVQTSPRYPGGVALRFARVVRYRPDKRPDEADTLDAVRALHRR